MFFFFAVVSCEKFQMELFSIFQNLTQTEREGRKNVNAKVLELLDKIF